MLLHVRVRYTSKFLFCFRNPFGDDDVDVTRRRRPVPERSVVYPYFDTVMIPVNIDIHVCTYMHSVFMCLTSIIISTPIAVHNTP